MSDDASGAQRVRDAYATLFVGGLVSWGCTLTGSSDRALAFAAVAAPAAIMLAAVLALIALARGGLATLGSPGAVLAFALGAYFGLGALLPVIAPLEFRVFQQELYPFTQSELVTVHRVTAVGTTVLALTAWITLRVATLRQPQIGRSVDVEYLRRSAVWLLIVGTGIRLLVNTPRALGLGTGLASGAIGGLEFLVYVGLILLSYGVASGKLSTTSDRMWLLFFGALNLALGLISLSKLNFFFSAGSIMGGIAFGRPQRRVFTIMAVIGFVTYVILQPFVSAGRDLRRESGETVGERISIIPSTTSVITESLESDYAGWFLVTRFNYTPAAIFAIRSYDGRQPGHSMTDKVLWTLVPRFVWPDKPNLTSSGSEVAWLMNGMDEGFIGIGVFGEGYWNAGYLGVVVGTALIGFLVAMFETVRWRALETFDVAAMYLFWYGCVMALRIDDWFLPTYVGVWPILVGTYVILRVAFGRAPALRAGRASERDAPAVSHVVISNA